MFHNEAPIENTDQRNEDTSQPVLPHYQTLQPFTTIEDLEKFEIHSTSTAFDIEFRHQVC